MPKHNREQRINLQTTSGTGMFDSISRIMTGLTMLLSSSAPKVLGGGGPL